MREGECVTATLYEHNIPGDILVPINVQLTGCLCFSAVMKIGPHSLVGGRFHSIVPLQTVNREEKRAYVQSVQMQSVKKVCKSSSKYS